MVESKTKITTLESIRKSQDSKEKIINNKTSKAIADVRMLQKTPGISLNLDESFTQEIVPLKNF